MELTLESVFSFGAWVGHLSYFLLVLSMLMRRIHTLRFFAILSALVGIAYDAVWLGDPVGVFWESTLLVVNVGQLLLMRWEDRRASFTSEEAAFMDRAFPDLPRARRRRLLDLGLWVTGDQGVVLTREGARVQHLIYLASGEAAVRMSGVDVATCLPGAFIGEMTVMNQEPATATAVLSRPSQYWMVDGLVLRQAVAADPDLKSALVASFSRNVRDKLVRTNRRIAGESAPTSAPRRPETRPRRQEPTAADPTSIDPRA